MCAHLIGVECQTIGGAPTSSTGQVYTCSVSTGGVCINSQQSGGQCQDYKVRFLCP